MQIRYLGVMVSFSLVVASAAWAQMTGFSTIPFQGVLTTSGGVSVPDGTYQMTFRLYEQATGGAAVWSETQNVNVQYGIFSVVLGSSTPIQLPFDRQYYLGITIGNGSELQPRIPLGSSAYSMRAKYVAEVTSGNLSGVMQAGTGITIQVTSGQVQISALTSQSLWNANRLQGTAIGSLAPTTGAVLQWDGQQWQAGELGQRAWLLEGNSGIDPQQQFVGTVDAQPLVFRTNNEEVMRITSSGNIGIGTTAPTQRLDIRQGNLRLDQPTSGNLSGIIYQGDVPVFYTWDYFGSSTTAGAGNLFIGRYAGNFQIGSAATRWFHGMANLGIGDSALHSLRVGRFNLAVGHAALKQGDTLVANTAIGGWALRDLQRGSVNVAVGAGAMSYAQRSVYSNVAIGSSAMYRAQDSVYANVAVGRLALARSTTNVRDNVVIGNLALYAEVADTVVRDNVAIGARALQGRTATSQWRPGPSSQCQENVVVGSKAMQFYRRAYRNVAVGAGSLTYLDSAEYNTAIGYWSGRGIVKGNENVVMGNFTLRFPDGYRNVIIGAQAANVNSTGATLQRLDHCVWVGERITLGTDQLWATNSIVIGSQAASKGSNTVVIGNDAIIHTELQGGIYADGWYGAGLQIPAGAKTAFAWYLRKGAIRAGRVTADQWDDGNIGIYSAAFGYNTIASGLASGALSGYGNIVSGAYAVCSGGQSNVASGDYSFVAGGYANQATQPGATVLGGKLNQATGLYATIGGGYGNICSGNYSVLSGGWYNEAIGFMSTIIGGWGNKVEPSYGCAGGVRMGLGPSAQGTFAWGVASTRATINTYYAFLIGPYGNTYRVGINVSSPTYALELPNVSTASIGQARANEWLTYSDARVKREVQGIANATSLLKRLRPVKYRQYDSRWEGGRLKLSGSGQQRYGFIAQELVEVVPEAVAAPPDERKDLWSVDYSMLIPILTAAMQEQQQQLEERQQQIMALQQQNQQLQQRTATLEQQNQQLQQQIEQMQQQLRQLWQQLTALQQAVSQPLGNGQGK